MGKATLSNSKSHHKFTNLNYEEKQVATPPSHKNSIHETV